MKTRIQSILIVITLLFSWILPQVRAVSPAPDGCYPNYTTAEGCNALNFLTTGAGNTGVGWYSLFSNSTGSFNTGVGGGALALNNAHSNTAVGAAALLLNTAGTENVAVGTDALVFNDSGPQNTASGAFALFSNTTGGDNTATGWHALFSNSIGGGNTAVGSIALATNVSGGFNVAVGVGALFTADASDNTAVGQGALSNDTTGHDNTAVGWAAGQGVTTASHVITIGTGGDDVDNSCWIGQIFGATAAGGSAVFIDANDRLGTMTSSKRFKQDIQKMNNASEALFALKPVTFHYKKEIDPAAKSQFGLVAEDVEKVNPDLVVRDKEGKAYSVR